MVIGNLFKTRAEAPPKAANTNAQIIGDKKDEVVEPGVLEAKRAEAQAAAKSPIKPLQRMNTPINGFDGVSSFDQMKGFLKESPGGEKYAKFLEKSGIDTSSIQIRNDMKAIAYEVPANAKGSSKPIASLWAPITKLLTGVSPVAITRKFQKGYLDSSSISNASPVHEGFADFKKSIERGEAKLIAVAQNWQGTGYSADNTSYVVAEDVGEILENMIKDKPKIAEQIKAQAGGDLSQFDNVYVVESVLVSPELKSKVAEGDTEAIRQMRAIFGAAAKSLPKNSTMMAMLDENLKLFDPETVHVGPKHTYGIIPNVTQLVETAKDKLEAQAGKQILLVRSSDDQGSKVKRNRLAMAEGIVHTRTMNQELAMKNMDALMKASQDSEKAFTTFHDRFNAALENNPANDTRAETKEAA